MLKRALIFFCVFFPSASFADSSVTFTSPVKQSTLLELYTSEGCSSCPPADRWLSKLKNDKKLWKEIVPIAFHVDYWDYLGWKDEFSKAEHTQRQRNYARWHNLGTIYTPGFVQNGKEWRGWRRGRAVTASGKHVGQLTVSVSKGIVTANFKPVNKITNPVVLNVAWLGFELETEIQGGENEGKKLKHDFVSFNTNAIKGGLDNGLYTWKFKADLKGLPMNKGAAFWITSGDDPTPLQATGGWLNEKG
jgi:hypothetical protein